MTEYCFFLLLIILFALWIFLPWALYPEYLIIQNLSNLFVLTELFPTPDLLDWRNCVHDMCVCVFAKNINYMTRLYDTEVEQFWKLFMWVLIGNIYSPDDCLTRNSETREWSLISIRHNCFLTSSANFWHKAGIFKTGCYSQIIVKRNVYWAVTYIYIYIYIYIYFMVIVCLCVCVCVC